MICYLVLLLVLVLVRLILPLLLRVLCCSAPPHLRCAALPLQRTTQGKCMGLKEKTAIDNFPRATLFRPGMLHRGLTDRPIEKYLGFLPALDVGLLAKAMVNDAESTPVAGTEEPHFVSGNGTITALAKV